MKKQLVHLTIVIITCLLLVGLSGCAETSSQSPDSTSSQMVNSGSWYTRKQWPHDGHTYTTTNFIIFSDAASQEARETLASVAEKVLVEVITEFEIIPEEMLRFPPGQDKIHIYAYKNYHPKEWGMRAYYAGLIAWSLDHEERSSDMEVYQSVLKHELVHVIQNLLVGSDPNLAPLRLRVDAWFSEGLAESMTGGTSGGAITSHAQLNALAAEYGEFNPMSYTSDLVLNAAMVNHPTIGFDYYYPISQLAVEYLFSAEGLGKSPADARDILIDVAEDINFATAFETHMGISIKKYKAEFFDRIDGYLEEGFSFPGPSLMLAWVILSALSIILVGISLTRSKSSVEGIQWVWLLITALYGPLGGLSYFISIRKQRQESSFWWRALVTSMVNVTGKAIGILIVILALFFFAPDKDSGPLILLIPLLISWLIFQAPLLTAQVGVSYWAALRRSFVAEFVSLVLVSAGMLPVLIWLPDRVWYFSNDPNSQFFWGLFSLSAIAGTLIVYPFIVWQTVRVNQTGILTKEESTAD